MSSHAQRDAFCISYGVSIPQLPLREIAHWEAMLHEKLSCFTSIHDEIAYVAPGFFYFPVTQRPTPQSLRQLSIDAESADWLLVPSLEKTDFAMRSAYGIDIVTVPFMQVAYLHAEGGLDYFLRQTIGSKSYKEMVRLTRRAEEMCDTEFWRLSDVSGGDRVIDSFCVLQGLNAEKYRHVRNLYSLEALRVLARSEDASRYYIKINYLKSDGAPVYASLSYADEVAGIFYQLVQGQDRKIVPSGLNLYVSDYYQLYRMAEELGFYVSCLGRGAIDIKRRLGCNVVSDLENWLIPIRTTHQLEMSNFSTGLQKK